MRLNAYRRHLATALSSTPSSLPSSTTSPISSRLSPAPSHFSSASSTQDGFVPIRSYIENALYAPWSGYFTRHKDLPILSHRPTRPHFSALKDRAAYQSFLADTFSRKQHGWMTPVELFSPYLANAVANRIAAPFSTSEIHRDKKLAIVEFGGGRGTLARDILTHIKSSHPDLYEKTHYHLVDISASLSQQQMAAVSEFTNQNTAHVHCKNAADWLANDAAQCVDKSQHHLHVLAFELLDNLPHDLFRYTTKGASHVYEQAYVHPDSRELRWSFSIDPPAHAALDQYFRHSYHHNSDDASILMGAFGFDVNRFMSNLMNKDGATYIWVPTVAHQILSRISGVAGISGASLTIADFTSFPGALPHINGPVVQRVSGGVATVYDSVLEAPHGEVDIMFPTDFGVLEKEYGGRTASQAEFFREFAEDADLRNSTCESGYNPILDDFKNTKFLLVDP